MTTSLHLLALSSDHGVAEWSDEQGQLAQAFAHAHLPSLLSYFPLESQPTLDWKPEETIAALRAVEQNAPSAPASGIAALREVVFDQVSAEDLKVLQQQTVTYTSNGRGESVIRYQGDAPISFAPVPGVPTAELERLLAFLEEAKAHNAELQVFEAE